MITFIKMKDIEILYENERIEQEVRSNSTIFKCILWVFAFFSLIWILNVLRIFIVPVQLMNMAYFSTLIVVALSVVIYKTCSLSDMRTKYLFLILICIACNSANAILSIHAILMYSLPIILAAIYRSNKALWITFIINSIGMAVSSIVAFYYGICDLNLLLDSSQTKATYMANYANGALTNNLNNNYIFVILFFAVMPRSLILFGFTLILRYFNQSVKSDMIRIASLTYSKDIDISTGVYNKNKLEELIRDYYPTIAYVGVIYLDINNLKDINDTYGHDMGDKLIASAVRPIRKYQNDKCKVFRFGGDEFLIIIENPLGKETEEYLKEVRSHNGKTVINNKINVSFATGYAEGYGSSIEEVIRKADEEMYRNKRETKGEA